MNMLNMVGKVFTSVTQDGYQMVFANETETFRFFHYQDCCESVYIDDIVGDLSDLEGEPLLMAEEVSGEACGFRSLWCGQFLLAHHQ